MVDVARRTSTTIPVGTRVASPGVKATCTRTPRDVIRRRYDDRDGEPRADADEGLLPPSAHRDGRQLLELRPADLHRLHGVQRGRDQVSRVRGQSRPAEAR